MSGAAILRGLMGRLRGAVGRAQAGPSGRPGRRGGRGSGASEGGRRRRGGGATSEERGARGGGAREDPGAAAGASSDEGTVWSWLRRRFRQGITAGEVIRHAMTIEEHIERLRRVRNLPETLTQIYTSAHDSLVTVGAAVAGTFALLSGGSGNKPSLDDEDRRRHKVHDRDIHTVVDLALGL